MSTVADKRTENPEGSDAEQVPPQDLKQSRGMIRMVIRTPFHGLAHRRRREAEERVARADAKAIS